ncbi:2'-5' RNA ligase family protein [Mucilaginibacter conchicola]|uniref:2'-5' RNA ligase family protein n=1 Tax=Mucilaginibacter conchicola TaxID=2303333 RepID=A0A372NX24_9SPHI|nr:2'-5' RNA ligase family protein [Mucilaginibacter conchicola]RFZ94411.1 2'-5' RNA ligase family protein [Mucilaginibacter conchicola]
MDANPLLITLKIDDVSQQYFNALRKQYFPPERNFLDAHLMLFHQLPADEQKIDSDIADIVSSIKVFNMQVSGPATIGRGVAYKIESAELRIMHKQMQQLWQQWLIPQDQHKLWPHITIQNKVEPAVAQETLKKVSTGFQPFLVTAQGLMLWEYQGGPWKFMGEWRFPA